MIYYAHTKDGGDWQLLKEHLTNAADLASEFARDGLKKCAAFLGLLHDIGKYQPSFQKRLYDNSIRIEHSACGAQEAAIILTGKRTGNIASHVFSYAVAGHHSGLPDLGNKLENDRSVLRERLKHVCEQYSAYIIEIGELLDRNAVKKELMAVLGGAPDRDLYEFVIRYLFSCLVDADFLDTEQFCLGRKRPAVDVDWELCDRELSEKMRTFDAVTELQKMRSRLQRQALANADEDALVYLLDMPTGSGKTLCSVALALYRLRKNRKKRIIYVIPYTSVIEQTARIFENIFPELTILQHHSGYDFDEAGENTDTNDEDPSEILKKSSENWDAPFIVTTNVQFFESIYSNRGSKLRKLHNMADSIIVFDEIHTLPVGYFIPCIKAVAQLTQNFGSEAIFLTATMPDFAELYRKYAERELPVCELIRDKSCFGDFGKYVIEDVCGEDISARLDGSKSVLVIFNTKKSAYTYYKACRLKDKYYLTTYLTPADRKHTIKVIREALERGEKIAVFSTSLVEAGVDLDFDCVFREMAGVDNILQAAGRCNREGRRAVVDSKVYVFTTECPGRGEIALKANITEGLLAKYGADKIASADCVREYFAVLYENRAWNMAGREQPVGAEKYRMDFETTAKDFKFIETTTVGVVVPCEKIKNELAHAEFGYAEKRKLQKYSAAVSFYELKKLCEAGVVSARSGVYILENLDYYSVETGIRIDGETDYFYD